METLPRVAFSQELADRICREVSGGRPLSVVCKDPDAPALSTVYNWRADNPTFKAQLQTAQESHADALMDEIVPIADTENDAQKARNRIQARQARAASIKPKEYGARVDLNITQTVDYRAAHVAAMERVRLGRDQVADLVPTIIDGSTTYIVKPTDGQSVTAPDAAVDPFS